MTYYNNGYLYDLLDGQDFSQDKLDYCLSLIQKPASHIADIACGTGLYSIPLARAGHKVTGLDVATGMLDYASSKLQHEKPHIQDAICFQTDDMRSFDVGQAIDLALILGQGFLHMLTFEDQTACLKNIRRQLAANGTLVLDFKTASSYADTLNGKFKEPSCWYSVSDPKTGHRLESWGQVDVVAKTKHLTLNRTIKEVDSEGNIHNEIKQTLYSAVLTDDDVNNLADACGFDIVNRYGGYRYEALSDESNFVVYELKPRI